MRGKQPDVCAGISPVQTGGHSRRAVLAGGVTTGLAALSIPAQAGATSQTVPPSEFKALAPDTRLTVNRERAYRIMKDYGVDVLVGAMEINARYLTNMRSIYADLGQKNRIIGVMTANQDDPIIAILPGGFDVQRYADPQISGREFSTYTYVQNADEYEGRSRLSLDDEPQASKASRRIRPEGASISQAERLWEDARSSADAATSELALRQVLREITTKNSTIAIDDAGIERTLKRYGMTDYSFVDARNLFRRIRTVKSPVEIDRLRVAAKLHGQSVRAMFSNVEPGMRYEDIQAAFFTEVAKRGGRPDILAAGMVGGLRSGELVRDEPLLIDGVAHWDGYVGDFGRTLVLGSASLKLERRAKVIKQMVEASFALVRPGISYDELSKTGREIGRKIDPSFPIGVGPHSVGMQHTDDPFEDGYPFDVRGKTVLEAGMVITLDMPVIEPGWGSTHMETMLLVTPDGAEWLDEHDDVLHQAAG